MKGYTVNRVIVMMNILTFQVAVCFWPVVQTINFAYVPEKNRVVVVSIASFIWTMFLSYMHHFDQERLPQFLRRMDQSGEAPTTGESDKVELSKDML